jgi:thiol-disulfide isomerase/thioredoxin
MHEIGTNSSWTKQLHAAALALAIALASEAFAGCGRRQSLTPSDLSVSFNTGGGKDVSLNLPCSNNCSTSLKGKVVLVNFWATWCDPCRAEIPSLIEFQKQYSDKGFTLLGIAMDDDGAKVVQPFVDTTKFEVNGAKMTMNYPIVIGSDSVADKFGGLWAYPTSVLLARNGKILKRFIGGLTPQDLQDIRNMLGS